MSREVVTGEEVSAGTYSCTNCGQKVTLDGRGTMPPCPRCSNTEFK